jgi:hypothetical protein
MDNITKIYVLIGSVTTLFAIIVFMRMKKNFKEVSKINVTKIGDHDFDMRMNKLSQLAAEHASRLNFKLDFSDGSIEIVEFILGTIHDQVPKDQRSGDSIKELAMAYGSYIGECIMRNHGGGSWRQHHAQLGNDMIHLSWSGNDTFLPAWCFNRVVNGPEDNIKNKYNVIVLKNNI